MKRIFDVILSVLALIILSPVLLIIAALIRIRMGSPVFFRQERVGKGNKPFTMYKFRTMSNETDGDGNLLPDRERMDKLGYFLRSTSMDELPEFLNVVKGDMSIIGPRPLPTNYLPYYTEKELHRHDVRGGITGLAQVNGRNMISWEEKFEHDLAYVDGMGFIQDIRILLKTCRKVMKRSDIGVRGETSQPDFHVYRKGRERT